MHVLDFRICCAYLNIWSTKVFKRQTAESSIYTTLVVLSFAMSGPVSVKLAASRPHWVVFRDYSSVNGNHFVLKKKQKTTYINGVH